MRLGVFNKMMPGSPKLPPNPPAVWPLIVSAAKSCMTSSPQTSTVSSFLGVLPKYYTTGIGNAHSNSIMDTVPLQVSTQTSLSHSIVLVLASSTMCTNQPTSGVMLL